MFTLQLVTVVGAAGLLICLVSLIALHLLPTGFHPIHDPVSNYAVSRYGFLYRLQAFSSGLCGVCLLVLLGGSGIDLPAWGLIALGGYALARLLIVAFPTDIQPPRTRTGTIHIILAALTFTGIACAAGLLTPPLTRATPWSNAGAEMQAAALLTQVSAILFVVVFSLRPLRPIVGLVERGIYLGALCWLGMLFTQLILTL